MNKLKCLPLAFLFLYQGASAQRANTDSLALVSKISADQLKLGKLQNKIDPDIKHKQDAAWQAQESANENSAAANNLSTDAQDKKLAKKADHAAGDAKTDARKARKASDRLDHLNKEIQKLTVEIAVEQGKLDKYIQRGMNAPSPSMTNAPLPPPQLPDTTQRPNNLQ
jgi:hypothetical protein